MNKKMIIRAAMLIAVAALTACSSSNEITDIANTTEEQQLRDTVSMTWNVIGEAVLTDADGTRAISIGGDNGKTLFANWQDNDIVEVYDNDGNHVGTLSAMADAANTIKAKLYGTITGTFNVGDQLTYYTRSKAYSPINFWYNDMAGWDNTKQLAPKSSITRSCQNLGNEVGDEKYNISNFQEFENSGWYLPSIGQLRLIVQNVTPNGATIKPNGLRYFRGEGQSSSIDISNQLYNVNGYALLYNAGTWAASSSEYGPQDNEDQYNFYFATSEHMGNRIFFTYMKKIQVVQVVLNILTIIPSLPSNRISF